VKTYTKEELKETSIKHGMTLKNIREFVAKYPDLPDDTPVVTERIHDVYFEKHGWRLWLEKGYWWHSTKTMNENMLEEISRREKGEEHQYPKIISPREYMTEITDELKDSFISPNCIVPNKDKDVVLIYLHH